ncbi:Putative class I-like SAM-dependent O-methyltransferase [Septoria linicola]|uniref:Class I-like SAM-dependent O-methyltransferase n=1 Tax=Septoria linicola TaxID=215465 RepID=A0A9Q9AMG5_9PEZI|nr:putative class I-like SAM-dependent O-methyltransferase [Septoria linicola]USW48717.1 Putative class I-like SAM-dependent O-methyltransferase [Septoria linicola]
MSQQQQQWQGQAHEKDPRWSAVDEYAKQHLITPADSPYYEALNFAAKNQKAAGLPDIAVSPLQGKFLALQCMLLNAKNALEVGTLGGYSTIWLASSSPDIRVTSIEVEAHNKEIAERAIANANLSDRVEILLGPGVEVMPKIRAEVHDSKREKFDFVFIDADKQNNLTYLHEAIETTRSKGLIIVDNVVRRGNTADAEMAKSDERVAGSRKVIEGAGKDPRLFSSVLQTVGEKNYDGFLLCVVR